jgi:chorismate synthase
MAKAYRPSHADATYDMKYGTRAIQVMSFGIEV